MSITPEFVRAVSAETGVPVEFLTGDTSAEVWDAAQRLADWKASAAPPTAAADASVPSTPVTAQDCAPDGDWLTAWRTGRLAPFGMAAPPRHGPPSSRGMPW